MTEGKDLGMIAKSYGYVYVAHEQNCQWPFCHGRQPGPVLLPNDTRAGGSRGEALCGGNTAEIKIKRSELPKAMSTLKIKYNTANNVIKEAFILRSLRSLSKVHWTFFTYHGPSLYLRLNPRNGYFSGLGSQVHWICSYATPLQSAVRPRTPLYKNIAVSNEEKKAVECGYSLFSADAIEAPLELLHIWHYNPDEDGQVLKAANTDGKEEMKVSNGFHLDSKEPDWSKLLTASNLEKRCSQPKHRDFIMGEVRYCQRLRTPVKIKKMEVSNSLMKTFPQEAEVPKAASTLE